MTAPGPRRIPVATYRLQMHAGFNLRQAIEIVPYLKALGVSHLYTSSLLTAKAGSTHGYDVADHGHLNPEIGTDAQFAELSRLLKANGMGLLLDVVPNHMSVGAKNAWWTDILENGPSSPYAGYFDIVWNDHPRELLRGKVLLPILGTSYGEAIDGGLFTLTFDAGSFSLHLDDARLPIDPRTYGMILEPVAEEFRDRSDSDDLLELQSILNSIRHLPPRTEADPARGEAARGEIAIIKRRLKEWAAHFEPGGAAIAKRVRAVAKNPVELDALIIAQAYRPCFWRVASDEINYRRFFDVNDLAALSTEKEEVFRDVHQLIFAWLEAGRVDGLRIDHPDGLFDPKRYLERLQENAPAQEGGLYVVVEKILGPKETLPEDWKADGTTGYEFANAVNGLFVDPDGEAYFSELFENFAGFEEPFEDAVYRRKFLVLQSSMTSELHVLAGHLDRLAQMDRSSRDFTLNGLRHVLREVLCCFPIYRTYIDGQMTEADRRAIRRAVWEAKRRNPLLGRDIFDFLRDTLLLKDPKSGPASEEYRAAQIHFAGKFQQLSSPVMAKGYEDTALYVYNRLISLNEVGGDPTQFGRRPADVHQFFGRRPRGGLSALSTHDTKRSEDVRARLNVLSEVPREWAEKVRGWSEVNRKHRIEIEEGVIAPDGNEEYLLYQTLLGTWPPESEWDRDEYLKRIQAFMVKALHEGKVHSSWINPNPEYDAAIGEFVARILNPKIAGEFLDDFAPFAERISRGGLVNSLAQSLVRCTAPGVPDIYQGTELWDFSLVDPDNRRPVDFAHRRRILEGLSGRVDPAELLANPIDGRLKLLVVSRALAERQRDPDLFEKGDYRELVARGEQAPKVFAFLRTYENRAALVAVPRLVFNLASQGESPTGMNVWENTELPLPEEWGQRRYKNAFTGKELIFEGGMLKVGEVLNDYPVALYTT